VMIIVNESIAKINAFKVERNLNTLSNDFAKPFLNG
jgi:hypothetical protein